LFQSSLAQTTLRVGAKHFNEGYILSEMVALLLEDAGYEVDRKFNLGGTAVCFEALKNGALDVYPEYTGTIWSEILKNKTPLDFDELSKNLQQRYALENSMPYGFNNTYALLVKPELANKLHLKTIHDLAQYSTLKGGISYEFLKREDGWENLTKVYKFKQKPVGLEHGLAYQAILNSKIDFTDAYSTDGEIAQHGLILLEDDLGFFPRYEAVSLYRASLPPKAKKALSKLTNILTEQEMQRLNAMALFQKQNHRDIARTFLIDHQLIANTEQVKFNYWADLLWHTFEHLKLTLLSLLLAIGFAVPFAVFLYHFNRFLKPALYFTGILQTIPSIALLALMIPLLGIGTTPAIIALFLYALLPILRNTLIGLYTVEPTLKKVATAIGLNAKQKLLRIELPLAMPMILTGIRTAAVTNVGTATLAAFIGSGGLGEYIVTGLALNDTSLILKGAIPSALLAILIELCFEGLERVLISAHLRQKIVK